MLSFIQKIVKKPVPTSNKKFGLFFSLVFLLLFGYARYRHPETGHWLLLAISGLFLFFAIILPNALSLLNRIWFTLGILLGMITNPIVLGIFFFLIITPLGLLTRLGGRDVLMLKRKSGSYWKKRKDQPFSTESFTFPF